MPQERMRRNTEQDILRVDVDTHFYYERDEVFFCCTGKRNGISFHGSIVASFAHQLYVTPLFLYLYPFEFF